MTPPILQYASQGQSAQFAYARFLLLIWQIVCVFAIPVGLVIGGAGTFNAVAGLGGGSDMMWNTSSLEDWIGFILWCINALGFMTFPLTWLCLCAACRRALDCGNIRGAVLAERLCRYALAAAAITALGLLYGLGKALVHGRWEEPRWWIGFLNVLIIYVVAIEYTRRTMRRTSRPKAP